MRVSQQPHPWLACAAVPSRADDLARFLAGVAAITPLFVRFGWEMNGSWYALGQQPAAFVRAFREVSAAVHHRTTRVSMFWAPNVGPVIRSPARPIRRDRGTATSTCSTQTTMVNSTAPTIRRLPTIRATITSIGSGST